MVDDIFTKTTIIKLILCYAYYVVFDYAYIYCITETEEWTAIDKNKEEEPLNA